MIGVAFGFYAAADLAKKAGVSPGLLHYYFENKWVERPTHQIGQRYFYQEEDFNFAVEQILKIKNRKKLL